MKLRDKETGEIVEITMPIKNGDGCCISANSLAELNEGWEDYEEPKEYWYIDDAGIVCVDEVLCSVINMRKEIGNYFETREEAERAVEKLKAWKRLKDKGIEFYGWGRNQTGTYELYMRWEDKIPISYEINKDIDLLFGGEDE